MERVEWLSKMILGFVCYLPVKLWPLGLIPKNSKVFMLIYDASGFYACGTGFDEWKRIKNSIVKK